MPGRYLFSKQHTADFLPGCLAQLASNAPVDVMCQFDLSTAERNQASVAE